VQEALERPKKLFAVFTAQSLDVRDYERFSQEREGYRKNLNDEEQKEIEIEEDYYSGKLSEEKKDTLIKRNNDKTKALKQKITELDIKLNDIVKAQATKEALLSFTERLHTKIEDISDEQKSFLMDLLIERVEVTFTKSHPIIHIIIRVAQVGVKDEEVRDEPTKSSNKPKVAY